MDKDISLILEGWEYRPDQISVRKIIGLEGKEKIQLRLELGLLQMEADGRPDGKRPHGKDSLLDHYLALIENHRTKHGTDEHFRLDREDCAKLSQESMQYYHRRISFFELGEYAKAEQDAEHNLQVMDLRRDYAIEEEDKLASEQYRPFVLMHRAKARVLISLERKDWDGALEEIQQSIETIERFFRRHDRVDLIESCIEISFLKSWMEEIEKKRPITLRKKLEDQLQEAIQRENFEKAAELRDLLRRLDEK